MRRRPNSGAASRLGIELPAAREIHEPVPLEAHQGANVGIDDIVPQEPDTKTFDLTASISVRRRL